MSILILILIDFNGDDMAKIKCDFCKMYIHDEAKDGKISELPSDWKCPVCGKDKGHLTILVK